MATRDDMWRKFVNEYDIEVPESAIENEVNYITLEMKHRIQYDRLSGGGLHLFPQAELEAQADEIRAAAMHEAKSDLVLKDIIAKQGIEATSEELELEAQRIAKEQGSTMDMLKRFFGDDFSMLARDVRERKAIDWACAQLAE